MSKYKDMKYTVRKDGRLVKKITANGKNKYLYDKDEKELYKKYIEYLHNSYNGIPDLKNVKMKEFSLKWIELNSASKEIRTIEEYTSIVNNHIIPSLGFKKIKDIKKYDIEQLLLDMKNTPTTANKTLAYVKRILNDAIDNDIIIKNVANNIKPLKVIKNERKPLTIDEDKILISSTHKYAPFFILMRYTGMRKEEIIPERTRRVYKDGKRVYESERQIRERERALHMNGSYVFFLTGVFAVCLAMCFGYLYVQSEIAQTRSEISKLKTDISTVASQNDSLNYSINSCMDTNNIYKKATQEMGMTQATDEQIVFYKSSDSGYTVQYGDIPKESRIMVENRRRPAKRSYKRAEFNKGMQKKLAIVFVLIILALFALCIRIGYLTKAKGDEYSIKVLAQQGYTSKTLPYKRGDILDRNGNVLATSVKVYNLVIDSKVILSNKKYLGPTRYGSATSRTCQRVPVSCTSRW